MTNDERDANKTGNRDSTKAVERDASDGTNKKKPYNAPRLTRWGSLSEITLAAGFSGASDGAHKGSNRTH